MQNVRVWDPFVRVFHWSLVAGFATNALLNDPEGQPHRWIGYGIVTLVLLRILWGFGGSRHARFADFPPSVPAALAQAQDIVTGRRRIHLGHSPLGALMIYNVLATMLLIGLTGYMMTTLRFFGVAWVEEADEILVTLAEFSVVLHILAVVTESRRLGINLPKSMVTGNKELGRPDGGL